MHRFCFFQIETQESRNILVVQMGLIPAHTLPEIIYIQNYLEKDCVKNLFE